jgi:hypothetical protein
MSDRELDRLFKKASRDLDQRQRDRIRQLKGIERTLFETLIRKLTDNLNIADGVIQTSKGSASINRIVDEAFRELNRGALKDFRLQYVNDVFSIIGNNDVYNQANAESNTGIGDKRFRSIRSQVDRYMRKSIGLDSSGKMIPGGYLDRLFGSDEVRTPIKEALNAGVRAGKPMSLLVKELQTITVGAKEVNGALRQYFEPFVLDQYQKFDRASNDAYAGKLGMDTFIYVGGLIETSREFCEKHNGKVFTIEEANEQWPKDPTLPRTSAERKSGTLVGYDPTKDLGRWNCRHRTRYIARTLAEQLRPDLKA